MKIASLTNTAIDPSLGSGKTVLAWSQGLCELGHEVKVFPPETYYQAWPGDKGRRIKMRLDAKRLVKTLLNSGYDLIEFYGAEFGSLINNLSRFPRERRPLLVAHTKGLELLARNSSENNSEVAPRSGIQRLMARTLEPTIAKWDHLAFSKVDAFAAICKADLNYIIDKGVQPVQHCAVIETGIDECYLSAPWQREKRDWLVSLGSWSARKDPQTTVRVASELLVKNPNLEFHVLGASDSSNIILNTFDKLLQSRIVVHPRLPEAGMVEVLSQSKVLFFPSLYEGFGMATTEAMACGCAVVVTPTGFGADIKNGVDGYVCDFRDNKTMVSHCHNLLNDNVSRDKIALAGHERVAGLGWDKQVLKLESTYESWVHSL